jgi:hypothetical protein
MKRLFKISKACHKYLGLLLILFLMWMSVTGVLLNHPDMISGCSVPGQFVPKQYHPQNWNRGGIRCGVFPEERSRVGYVGGKLGVFKCSDGIVPSVPMQNGFPTLASERETNHLLLHNGQLLAATDGGLYACDLVSNTWHEIELGGHSEPVLKTVRTKERILAFTPSQVYSAQRNTPTLQFKAVALEQRRRKQRVSLITLFFELHDGSIWGLPGRLLFDTVGVVVFLLCISAFYIWYTPKRLKRRRAQGKTNSAPWAPKVFRFFFNTHLKLGIWVAVVLLIIGGTGLFMRPPLIILLTGDVSATWYPGSLGDNPWHETIRNALYDPVRNTVVLDTTEGVWEGPTDLDGPFARIQLSVPIFAMGATVFECDHNGDYLVGSFNGLFRHNRAEGKNTDMMTRQPATQRSPFRPHEFMVWGYFQTPNGNEVMTSHRQGLTKLNGRPAQGQYQMPEQVRRDYRMPLWNYLFEIHNGRFFRDWIGPWYILVIPLGALLFVVLVLSGVYDWMYRWFRPRK